MISKRTFDNLSINEKIDALYDISYSNSVSLVRVSKLLYIASGVMIGSGLLSLSDVLL